MGTVSDLFQRSMEIRVRRAATAALNTAVLLTPVDTGRARAHWNVGVGFVDDTVSDATDRTGVSSIARGAGVIAGWKLKSGLPILLSNHLDYIEFLDKGSSLQAPNGMTGAAIIAARRELGGRFLNAN